MRFHISEDHNHDSYDQQTLGDNFGSVVDRFTVVAR